MGFSVLSGMMALAILIIVIIFSRLRMHDSRLLNHYHQMDLGIRCRRYRIGCSLSKMNDYLLHYRPAHHDVRLETPSALEFVVHDYQTPGKRQAFFHPYFHIALDESRIGSQLEVYQKLRCEVLLGISLVSLILFKALQFPPLMVGLLSLGALMGSIAAMAVWRCNAVQSLDQLLNTLTPSNTGDGPDEDPRESPMHL